MASLVIGQSSTLRTKSLCWGSSPSGRRGRCANLRGNWEAKHCIEGCCKGAPHIHPWWNGCHRWPINVQLYYFDSLVVLAASFGIWILIYRWFCRFPPSQDQCSFGLLRLGTRVMLLQKWYLWSWVWFVMGCLGSVHKSCYFRIGISKVEFDLWLVWIVIMIVFLFKNILK